MTGARVVWFHRCRATLWALAYPATVALGVADSVALVWFASCYANVVSDLARPRRPTTGPCWPGSTGSNRSSTSC